MHIAIAFDQNFLIPFYVLITSIFENTNDTKIYIHTIASGIEEIEKKKIQQFIQNHNGEIYFYEIKKDNLKAFVIPENSYFTLAAYYRLFFPSLVPTTVDKLIYLDTDTVVVGDLKELFKINIDNLPLAAVPDPAVQERVDLGIYEKGEYFNSGVLLINNINWKSQKITEKAIDFLHKYPEKIRCVDQDALNAVLSHNYLKLSSRFNITFYDIPADLPKKQYANFLKDKVVIHYTTGLHKPWSFLGENKLRYLYHSYLKKTPFSNSKKYVDVKITKYYILNFLRIRTLEYLLDYPLLVKALRKLK